MSAAVQRHDTLTVINGPEDGTEFSLTQRRFAIGAGGQCVVNLRLDQLVQPLHARAEVISEGYRLRTAGGACMHVNGQRVGAIRSRVVKHGDILRVGETELVLTCGAEGLAGRSRGLRRQSDWLWALRETWRIGARVTHVANHSATKTFWFVRRHLLFWAAVALVAGYFIHPGLRALADSLLARAKHLGLF